MLLRTTHCCFFVATVLTASSLMAQPVQVRDKIDDKLVEILESTEADQQVRVSVVLRDQTPAEVIEAASKIADKEIRRQAVISALKETANQSQVGIVNFLEAKQQEAAVGPVIRRLWLHNVISADVTPEIVHQLAARDDVERVNDNATVGEEVLVGMPTAKEPRPAIECGVEVMRAPEVWDQGITGQGVVVCVVDTGCCVTHADLQNQIWVNSGEIPGNNIDDDNNGYIDDINGWNFEDNNANITDTNSHGTHVSGTVGGDGTEGETTGMAPNVQIMTTKYFNNLAGESSVWNCMQYGVDNGAHVITASLGWQHQWGPDRDTWRNVCNNAIAAGVVVVYAAGNEGSGNEPDNVRTPGDVPDVITVGATDCDDNIAGFSSRGPVTWQDVSPWFDHPFPPGLIKPTISAPGVNTLSTSNNCTGYSVKSGTSMAAPHVAGCIALMLEANPALDHFGVKQILNDTAVDFGASGNDNVYGWGRVDAFEAVSEAANQASTVGINFPNGRPEFVAPAGGTVIRVTASNEGEQPQPGTGRLYYDNGDGFQAVSMTQVSDNVYDAVIPASECNSTVRYYVTVESTDGTVYSSPNSAPNTSYSALAVAEILEVYSEDFETDTGWTVSGDATDGQWDRGVPVGGGDRGDPASDGDGSGACYLTDNEDGNSDVDGGTTILTSPLLDATVSGSDIPMLSYRRWYSNDFGGSPNADVFTVEISNNGGSTWMILETVGPDGAGTGGGWFTATFQIDQILAPTDQMRLRFSASDLGDGSVVEAGIDGLSINMIQCGPDCLPGDVNMDGEVNLLDVNGFVEALSSGDYSCEADVNGDGIVNLLDVDPFIATLSGS